MDESCNEERGDVVEPLQRGAAIKRMQQLAQEIYSSTPRLAEQYPKKQSKILSNLKRDTDDEKGTIRASLFISAESVKLAKQGRIQNRDLAVEVCA